MSEYHLHVGRRAELRQAALKLKIAADSHRDSLRLKLDPLAEIGELPAEEILHLAAALAEAVTELREVRARIRAVNDLIGE